MSKTELHVSDITTKIGSEPVMIECMAYAKTNGQSDLADTDMPAEITHMLARLYAEESVEGLFTAVYNSETQGCYVSDTDGAFCAAYIFNVYTPKETDAVLVTDEYFRAGVNVQAKLWLNGNFVGICTMRNTVQVHLKAGNNSFVFRYNVSEAKYLRIRMSTLSYEMTRGFDSAVNGNLTKEFGKVDLLDIERTWNRPGIYKGMLYSLDHVGVDLSQTAVARVLSYDSDVPVMELPIRFYEPFHMDLSEIVLFTDDRLNYYKIQIEYVRTNGGVRFAERFFCFDDFETVKAKFEKQVRPLLNDMRLPESTRIVLEVKHTILGCITEGEISYYQLLPRTPHILMEQLKLDINRAVEDIRLGRKYHPRRNTIIFRSALDFSRYNYEVYLPENYDEAKAYPLIINHATNESMDITSVLEAANYASSVIIANVRERDMTVGSYVGEASMNEILTDIRKRFLIDESRVSAMGYSNGAYAAWLQAQMAPHRFAAIAPYVGAFHPDLIKNLTNVQILDTESESDAHLWNEVKKNEAALRAVVGYSLNNIPYFNHKCMATVRLNTTLLDYLSGCTVDKYPNEIHFRAIHNRHLEAYWITVHSIEDTAEFADIEARIVSADTIAVECSGLTGFTVRIPPQMTGDTVTLIVNGQSIFCERAENGEIGIVKAADGTYTHGAADPEAFKIYHGTGLIDGYLTPLSIVNFAPEIAEMDASAHQFSTPHMFTNNAKIKVRYGIYEPHEITDLTGIEDFAHRSLILLDNNSRHPYAEYIRKFCKIETDEGGFSYQGKRYDGEYCVMQIFPHPEDAKCSVLYINANNPTLYKKNFFTRQVILPMYSKNRHPYLHNAALVFYENKYYTVYEYGCDLCEVIT